MEWKKIYFNSLNIIYEGEKSCLIKMPNNSRYKDYKFWHPAKLVRELTKGNGYFKTFSFTEEWEFNIFKDDKNYNRTKEIILSSEEMEDEFETVNIEVENQSNSESFYKEYEPKKIDKDVEVLDELTR
ncbi:TPA: hypothetical protein U3L45_000463 [Streptococcus agalactiae]|uniref:hypothetical protein n=1 Tax=Streptococcus agalactiae TaxID=1311 RepID=UPI002AB95FE2|nr:hypothetical protein [Streptococcus agalactiae]HEM9597726.1 hypothetical protein [Streptococcus agalactiae]HEM9634619.1 hypothetical protein [Streptococcus agalactiae]HEN0239741.1 hypothetical protein [Streptococcus agalactiae]HEN0428085.1 hypothetical protein [Streptococcus agalactiae]